MPSIPHTQPSLTLMRCLPACRLAKGKNLAGKALNLALGGMGQQYWSPQDYEAQYTQMSDGGGTDYTAITCLLRWVESVWMYGQGGILWVYWVWESVAVWVRQQCDVALLRPLTAMHPLTPHFFMPPSCTPPLCPELDMLLPS